MYVFSKFVSWQILPEWFGLMDVKGGSSYPALFKSLCQSFLIDQTAPCCVD